ANGLGGIYKTTNSGVSWVRIKAFPDGVTSCTLSPTDPNVMYFTSQTQGLWYSNNRSAPNPTFAQVASYPFRQPMRVFFNPYDLDEVWVSSFGNGMKVGRTVQVTPKPGVVILQSPVDGAANQAVDLILNWKLLAEATSFEVQVSTSQSFSTTRIDSSGVKTTTLPISGLQEGVVYYWRVIASNAGGVGPWSEVWKFTTFKQGNTPSPVTLIFPPNNSTPNEKVDELPPYQLHFLWSSIVGALSYDFRISKDKNFLTIELEDSTITDTIFHFAAEQGTKYWWNVRAKNSEGWGQFSAPWSFSNVTYSGVENSSVQSSAISNFPNPFSSKTTISYSLKEGGIISLKVFDLLGREIQTLQSGFGEAGNYSMSFDAGLLPSGLYIVRLSVNGNSTSRSVQIVK
ncbi:MAG: T9SS type A sorting domain-containing protein, partial [Ignavibacteriota bacterium]